MMITDIEWLKFKRRVLEKMDEDKKQEVSSWAKEAWEWGKREGITDGTNPKNVVTREMLVTMLYRMRG